MDKELIENLITKAYQEGFQKGYDEGVISEADYNSGR